MSTLLKSLLQPSDRYNEDPTFADHLSPAYKDFELRHNAILKPIFPAFTDEIKRSMWVHKSFLIKGHDLPTVTEQLATLICKNFENGDIINSENRDWIQYLTEKKTGKIYKVKAFGPHYYHYLTLGEKAILSVKFTLKAVNKTTVKIKYFQGFHSETAFRLATLSETKHLMDAKIQFRRQFQMVEAQIRGHLAVKTKD